MRGALYEAFGEPFGVRQLPDPEPPADGVVIRVEATGICRSDWHGWMGHDADVALPHVPGHELAGVVADVGVEVKQWQPGDRVTVPFAVGCGECEQCQSGNPHICDNYFQPGFTAWGSFAEYVAVPHADANLVRLPDKLDFVTAATLGCRFTTAFRAVVDQGRAAPGEWVVVYGCGGVGLSAIMIASAVGAQVIAVDIKEEQLALARGLGASQTVDASRVDEVQEAVRELSGGGAHLSLDALGSPETARQALLSLRKRGRHVQVGLLVHGDTPLPLARLIAWELEIYGSHGMPAADFPRLLAMISQGQLDPRKLVRKRVSLEEAPGELMAMGAFSGSGITVVDRFS